MKKILILLIGLILSSCSEPSQPKVEYRLDVFGNGDGYVIVEAGNQVVSFRGTYDCNLQSDTGTEEHPNIDSILLNPASYSKQEVTDAKLLYDCSIGIRDSYGDYYVVVSGLVGVEDRWYSIKRVYYTTQLR